MADLFGTDKGDQPVEMGKRFAAKGRKHRRFLPVCGGIQRRRQGLQGPCPDRTGKGNKHMRAGPDHRDAVFRQSGDQVAFGIAQIGAKAAEKLAPDFGSSGLQQLMQTLASGVIVGFLGRGQIDAGAAPVQDIGNRHAEGFQPRQGLGQDCVRPTNGSP